MNFDEAIASHAAWRSKLVKYLKKRDGSLKAADLSLDTKCALGQWIYGEGDKYSQLAEFANLNDEHARFHRAVGEVVRRVDSGNQVEEETSLGSKSEFVAASTAVVAAIVALRKAAQAKATGAGK